MFKSIIYIRTVRVRRVDRTYRLLELEDRSLIELEQILELRGRAVEE